MPSHLKKTHKRFTSQSGFPLHFFQHISSLVFLVESWNLDWKTEHATPFSFFVTWTTLREQSFACDHTVAHTCPNNWKRSIRLIAENDIAFLVNTVHIKLMGLRNKTRVMSDVDMFWVVWFASRLAKNLQVILKLQLPDLFKILYF